MPKKYNYKEFKTDPRTFKPDGTYPRNMQALFNCIDNNQKSPAEITEAIEKVYLIGKHRSPHYIKKRIKQALRLLDNLVFFLP